MRIGNDIDAWGRMHIHADERAFRGKSLRKEFGARANDTSSHFHDATADGFHSRDEVG